MNRKKLPSLTGLALLLSLTTGGATLAGLDVDLAAALSLGDDDDIYVAVSARYFEQDHETIRAISVRYDDPDDLAVALFIGRNVGKSPDYVYSLRHRGLPWFEICARLGVTYDAFFVPVKRVPGPPYGRAYGHYKKHGKRAAEVYVLTDADVRNLVAVRMLHEYYGVDVEMAMHWRSSGRNLNVLVAEEYTKRHGRPDKASTGRKSARGNQGNKGKGNKKQ
jgi:hypothetical protein